MVTTYRKKSEAGIITNENDYTVIAWNHGKLVDVGNTSTMADAVDLKKEMESEFRKRWNRKRKEQRAKLVQAKPASTS